MRASSAASSIVALARSRAPSAEHDRDLAAPRVAVRRERRERAAHDLFVQLRELARDARGALGHRVGELARASRAVRSGDSKSTTGSGVAHTVAIASRRAAPSRGRKPTKRKPPPVASPLATSAASTALAPGIGTTRTPAAIAARTSASPGSLTAGVPASVTSATDSPGVERSTSARDVAVARVRVERVERLARDAEVREQLPRAPRVLGGDAVARRQRRRSRAA